MAKKSPSKKSPSKKSPSKKSPAKKPAPKKSNLKKSAPKKSAPAKRAAPAKKKPAARKAAAKRPAKKSKAPLKKMKAVAKRVAAKVKAAPRKLASKALPAKKKKVTAPKAVAKAVALKRTIPAKKAAVKKAPAKPAAPKASAAPAHVFCWAELATNDVPAAKAFYTELFPWEMSDMPLPDGSVYSMATINGGTVGAMFTMQPEMSEQGITLHWNAYINTPNIDATARRVVELGGKLHAAPFDVMDAGRMAVAEDPTGAMFSLWQAGNHKGFAHSDGRPGTYCWAELMTSDVAKAGAFYGNLLGWTGKVFSMDPTDPYTVLSADGQEVAGMHGLPEELKAKGVTSDWILYWVVNDCDATTNKARALGAMVHMEPTSLPTVGRMAVLRDPQGAAFAVLQPE